MRIGYMGLREIYGPHKIDDILKSNGNNTGNLVFSEACKILFNDEIIELSDSTADVLFFACSNWLHEKMDIKYLLKILKTHEGPVICVGLGSQNKDYNSYPKLPPDVIEFLKVVSNRTPYILVRGNYTKQVCQHYGVYNVKVGGCPSILYNSDLEMGPKLENSYNNIKLDKICGNMDLNITNDISTLLSLNDESSYVLQNERAIMKIINKEETNPIILKSFLKVNSKYFETTEQVLIFILQNMKYFSNMQEWVNHITKFNFAIGTRIHGTLLCILNGIPSLCITIDSRTKELCQTLHIPHISLDEYNMMNRKDLIKYIQNLKFDGESFEDNRKKLARLYIDLFAEIGLNISDHLYEFL